MKLKWKFKNNSRKVFKSYIRNWEEIKKSFVETKDKWYFQSKSEQFKEIERIK